MCECGCGEGMNPTYTFPGPDGLTYAIALYTGCEDCGNPAGVMLYEIASKDLEGEDSNWGPPDWRTPLTFVANRYGWREVAIPTLLTNVKNFRRKARLAFDEFEKFQRSTPPGEPS